MDTAFSSRTLGAHRETPSHQSFPAFRVFGERKKNLLERALSIFADVRAGEGVTTVLMTLNVFIFLVSIP